MQYRDYDNSILTTVISVRIRDSLTKDHHRDEKNLSIIVRDRVKWL